mmetsp:Transcript_45078/g.104034  ORF Transcript_45078/g.104034 Transcript_45078/m.104034 type:complete len:285 (-) Transcript_45078:467-1321(-)
MAADASAEPKWDKNMSQEDFMFRDECILLDKDDNVTGHANKKISHVFAPEAPRALLHRAFSVFLFDSQGRLLLQKRAASKITFPNVWTNTCCSHPLYGFSPTEVDTPADVADGSVMGTKRAAIRKLDHELGIEPSAVDINGFKFLTRLHYWAADVVTHGAESPWGEHEIDYILFYQADGLKVSTHTEEVDDTKWVTHAELLELMKPESGLLWSPWFRIIVERFLVHWWKDLDATLSTDKHCDFAKIHRFDPTHEHMGGGGKAGPWLDVCAEEEVSNGLTPAPPQ